MGKFEKHHYLSIKLMTIFAEMFFKFIQIYIREFVGNFINIPVNIVELP